jgi:hypothetical protein
MQNDTDAGSDELPAYCRGILKTCSKAITFWLYPRSTARRTHATCETTPSIRLESTSRRHLLAEMVLVLADASVPPADGLVFANHNVLCNLVKQSVRC